MMKKTSLLFKQMQDRFELQCCKTCPHSSKDCVEPCMEARKEIYGSSPFRNMVLKLSDLIFILYCLVFHPKRYASLRDLLKRRGITKVLSRCLMLLVVVLGIVLSIVSLSSCSQMKSLRLDLKMDYGVLKDSASVTLRRVGRNFIADNPVYITLPRKDIRWLCLSIGNERFFLLPSSGDFISSILSRSPINNSGERKISSMCGLQNGRLVPLRSLNASLRPLPILSTVETGKEIYINQ